jgi:hypothetical protein
MASMSSSCLAAAQQAESGAWLALLEQHMQHNTSSSGAQAASGHGGCWLPAVAPPGLKRGMFGAWALPQGQQPTGALCVG